MSKKAPIALGRPWSRRPRETAKAYNAFFVYAEMGPERSFRGLTRALDRPVGYEHVIYVWRDKHNWEERIAAYDSETLERSMERRIEVIERVRQKLIDKASAAADKIGEFIDGSVPEKDASTILQACVHAIEFAGITKPKRIELTDAKADRIMKEARREAKRLGEGKIIKLMAIMSVEPSDGEGI